MVLAQLGAEVIAVEPLAGPLATRLLADLGATVVRIENERRLDVIRASGTFLSGEEGGDATALWHNTAAGKYSLELDLTTEAGREVVFDLARWADVAYESLSAEPLDRAGLGYQTLSKITPRLVMVSTSLLGQTGPLASFAGFGNLAAALAGFVAVTGWPDRPPAGPFTENTNYVSPRFAAAAILAAVDHTRRTGTGQYLDVSQAEAASHLLAPALLAQQIEGLTAVRSGNADPVLKCGSRTPKRDGRGHNRPRRSPGPRSATTRSTCSRPTSATTQTRSPNWSSLEPSAESPELGVVQGWRRSGMASFRDGVVQG